MHVGIKFTADFNAPGGREGAGYYHFNIAGGTRDSAAKRMLADVMFGKRSNLRVELGAEVRRVLLEPSYTPSGIVNKQQQHQQQSKGDGEGGEIQRRRSITNSTDGRGGRGLFSCVSGGGCWWGRARPLSADSKGAMMDGRMDAWADSTDRYYT